MQEVNFQATTRHEFDDRVFGPFGRKVARDHTALPRLWPLILVGWMALLFISFFLLLAPPPLSEVPFLTRVLVSTFVLLLALKGFEWRSKIFVSAYAKNLFSNAKGIPTLMAAFSDEAFRPVSHVFGTTSLQTAAPLYFSARWIFGAHFGVARPGRVTLAEVVTASTANPGPFASVMIATKDLQFKGARADSVPPNLALMDGGLCDNYADQWPRGMEARRCGIDSLKQDAVLATTKAGARTQLATLIAHDREWFDLKRETPPRQLVLVNATQQPDPTWQPSALPIIGELTTLYRVVLIMLQAALEPRKQPLVAGLPPGVLGTSKHSPDVSFVDQSIPGTPVDIAHSPFDVIARFHRKDTDSFTPIFTKERSERAEDVRRLLKEVERVSNQSESEEMRRRWRQRAEESEQVGTTLVPLGADLTARLAHHGYILAMTTLHIVFNYPLLDASQMRSLDDIRTLFAGKPSAPRGVSPKAAQKLGVLPSEVDPEATRPAPQPSQPRATPTLAVSPVSPLTGSTPSHPFPSTAPTTSPRHLTVSSPETVPRT